MKHLGKLLTSAALALAATGTAALAEYPERPVTIIVPWGAGGGTDTIIRIFATSFEEKMGQPINVVNRDGGSGVVGHMAISQAKPDGYTLGACTPEITYFKTMGLADIGPENFTLISRLALIPAGVTVASSTGDTDLAAFLEAVKTQPAGYFTSSGSGVGGTWHMAVAGLATALGQPIDKIDFVPSKGGAPALQDLVAGGINLFTGSPVEAKALAEAGQVRILGIMADERSAAFPDVPTLKESGVDFSISNWFSLCAPAGLPEDVTAAITKAAEEAHATATVQDALKQRGITPYFDGPEAFKVFADEFAQEAQVLLTELDLAD